MVRRGVPPLPVIRSLKNVQHWQPSDVHNGENSAHHGAITVGSDSVDIPVSVLIFPSRGVNRCYSLRGFHAEYALFPVYSERKSDERQLFQLFPVVTKPPHRAA